MENLEKERRQIVEFWNTQIACRMPSKKQIRRRKKELQNERQYRRQFLAVEKELLDLSILSERGSI